ncbi:MAG: hypothetical protein K2Q13_10255 [Nitrosomonas sp.]|uniref:hypothetical protein n=1 Tax=Nitrosomonas sp. TaxID=42353 RepID=UPI0025CB98A0|nr:hypothetical protein [Nitrosomonas sp.]MBY0475424.1 hypothetical protein [Nitrosomonas sp.]
MQLLIMGGLPQINFRAEISIPLLNYFGGRAIMQAAILIRTKLNDQFVVCYPYSTIPLKERSTAHNDFNFCWQIALSNNLVEAGTEELYYYSFIDLDDPIYKILT